MSRLPDPSPDYQTFVCARCGASVSPFTRNRISHRLTDEYEAKR